MQNEYSISGEYPAIVAHSGTEMHCT